MGIDTRRSLSAEHLLVQDEARKLAAGFADVAAEADELATPHLGMRRALADSGLVRLLVPAAYGGRYDSIDTLAVTLVREQLMAVSAHLDTLFCMQGIGSYPLARGGSEELRRTWLPRVVEMDAIAALALTEDDAGSDLKAVATTIEQQGDRLVVHGRKSWISNGTAAEFFCTLAREGDGYSMVLVPADAAGVTVTPTETIIAPHVMGDITFDGVELPAGNRLGDPGKAWSLVFATLGSFRVSVAGAAVGLAQAALDAAARHAVTRHQFGRPLAEIGPVGQLLARAWADLESARVFVYQAAAQAAEDPRAALDVSSMAKVVATEAAARIVDNCVQVMGRYGLVRDSVIERAYRAARPMRIYEGATETVLDSLSKELVKQYR
jgi:acyl-CoA dehydrogenase